MVHYQLICSDSHAFDGWFRDSQSFDAQAASGLVACPECGSASVRRALMAPRIGKRAPARDPGRGKIVDQEGRAEAPPPDAPAPEPAPQAVAAAKMPDQVRAMLQKLRAEVERNCEHVGDRFASEARAIHEGKAEARGIFGQSTPEEAKALAEDGIEIARIPWVDRADS